jgi:hypothetical protein
MLEQDRQRQPGLHGAYPTQRQICAGAHTSAGGPEMSCRNAPVEPPQLVEPDYAETVVWHAYMYLPLIPRHGDGTWVAPLKRTRGWELRLVEHVPSVAGGPVLRVEIFDRARNAVVESRDCEEIEDAVAAFKAFIPLLEAYAKTPDRGSEWTR